MSDITVEILREIRDEIRQTNQRLDSARVELKSELAELRARQIEMETRLATELVDVVGAIRELRDALVEFRNFRDLPANHEQRIGRLEQRTAR